MSEELKPCPFCGGEATLFIRPDYNCTYYFIECQGNPECAGGMMDETAYGSKEDARKAWNTRATETKLRELVEELREEGNYLDNPHDHPEDRAVGRNYKYCADQIEAILDEK